MADEFELKVDGLREIRDALRQLPNRFADKVVIDALKLGARVVQRQAKANAPRKSGRLFRGIVVRKSKIHRRKTGKIGVYLTLRKGKGKSDSKDAFYGRFQEDGWTDPAGKKHPGKGFIKNALAAQRATAIQLIIHALSTGHDIIKRRLGLK